MHKYSEIISEPSRKGLVPVLQDILDKLANKFLLIWFPKSSPWDIKNVICFGLLSSQRA